MGRIGLRRNPDGQRKRVKVIGAIGYSGIDKKEVFRCDQKIFQSLLQHRFLNIIFIEAPDRNSGTFFFNFKQNHRAPIKKLERFETFTMFIIWMNAFRQKIQRFVLTFIFSTVFN